MSKMHARLNKIYYLNELVPLFLPTLMTSIRHARKIMTPSYSEVWFSTKSFKTSYTCPTYTIICSCTPKLDLHFLFLVWGTYLLMMNLWLEANLRLKALNNATILSCTNTMKGNQTVLSSNYYHNVLFSCQHN